MKPGAPANETERLLTLRGLRMLDTLPEERFDRITRLARRLFGVPIALISLVDAKRQWFKSRQGLDATETSREISFCAHAIADDQMLVVPDATTDERFADNPLVQGAPTIRFYAGCPVHAADGSPLGTLCLIDRQPRQLGAEDLALLRDLAAMVEDEINAAMTSMTDPLTGISNRLGFQTLGALALALNRRLGGPITMLVFDLDGFKAVNDELGHASGDLALVDFATTLVKTFRDADVIGRLGGDEFCVLATGATSAMAAPLARLAENLDRLDARPYRLAFSVGAALYAPDRHASLDALAADADREMYELKRQRRL